MIYDIQLSGAIYIFCRELVDRAVRKFLQRSFKWGAIFKNFSITHEPIDKKLLLSLKANSNQIKNTFLTGNKE